MLIVYDLTTGDILDNPGTSSTWPEGPPDDDRGLPYVNTDRRGIDRATLGLLRLHDRDDADLVAQVLANRHHVDPSTGQVVIDGPHPTLEAAPLTIPADGTTAATVRHHPGETAPASVTFDVNGAAVVEDTPDPDGWFAIEVDTATPGPVVVTVGTLTVTIEATEV